jgi:TPR repeat protein
MGDKFFAHCLKIKNLLKSNKVKDDVMTENRTISISELQQKANAGDAQVQFELASCYANGTDAERNAEPALEWLRKAAEQGHINAQHALGLYYFLEKSRGEQASRIINKCLRDKWINKKNVDPALDLGVGLAMSKGLSEANDDLAFSWLKKASEQNHVEANHWLGVCYQDGIGTQQNDQLAFDCFKKAAGQEIAESQYALALCYFEGKCVAQSDELGLHWCTKASDNDNPSAQYFLAKCYRDGKHVQPNDDLALNWVKKAAENHHDEARSCLEDCLAQGGDAENSNEFVLKWSAKEGSAEAQYRLARMYLESNESKEYRTEGLYWLIQAVLSNHVGANQWFADTYLQFVFPYFSGRGDIEQCYQCAFDWLSKAYQENQEDFEINFGLGVLYAFGKGVEKNQELACKYFSDSQSYNPGHGDWDLLCLIYDFCALFPWLKKGDCYIREELAGFFISDSYISSYTSRPTTILPLLRFEFHLGKNEFMLLRDYLDNLEGFASTFNSFSQKSFKSMGLTAIKQAEKLDAQNRQLLEAEKELEDMMSMFAHKFRSPLDAIIYNTTHENQVKLYTEAAQTMRGLLDVFSIISTDPDLLNERLKQDHQGNCSLLSVFGKTLDMLMLHLLSAPSTGKIQQHHLAYAKTHGLCTPGLSFKSWYDDFYELEQELQAEWEQSYSQLLNQVPSLEERLAWLEQHFFKLEIKGFDDADIRFKEFGFKESFLMILLNEILVNAFKYYSSLTRRAVVLEWVEHEGYQVLSCRNPSTRSERRIIKGSRKGHTFLSVLARKTGSRFSKPTLQDDFVVEFGIPYELLLCK